MEQRQELVLPEKLQLHQQQQQQMQKKRRQITATLNGSITRDYTSSGDNRLQQVSIDLHSSAGAAAAASVEDAAASVATACVSPAAAAGVACAGDLRSTKKMLRQQSQDKNKWRKGGMCSTEDVSGGAAVAAAAASWKSAEATRGGNVSRSSSSSSTTWSSRDSSSSSRSDVTGNRRSRSSSVLFQAVRTIGKVTEGLPFSLSSLGGRCFICCSVGRTFQVYDGQRLRMVFTSSPPLQQRIRLLLADRATVFVAERRRILSFRRLENVLSFSLPAAAAAGFPSVARRCTCCRQALAAPNGSCSNASNSYNSSNDNSRRRRTREAWCDACEELQEEEKLKGMFVMGEWLVGFTSLQLCVWNKDTGRLLRVVSPAEALAKREQILLQQQQQAYCGVPHGAREAIASAAADGGGHAAVGEAARTAAAVPAGAALGGCLQTAYPGLLLSAAIHPNTYLRKALLGFENGVLLIVNLHTGACVHELRCLYTTGGTGGVPITPAHAGDDGTLLSSNSAGEESDDNEEEAAASSAFLLPAAAAAAGSAAAAASVREGAFGSGASWGGVTCLAASGEPDVVAVGFTTGRIAVVDIKRDDLLLQFSHTAAQGTVCTLAFRREVAALDLEEPENTAAKTGEERPSAPPAAAAALPAAADAAAAAAVLVSGARNGDLLVWNLETGAFHGLVPKAHDGPILALQFYPGQPLLLSSGVDNALILWIFDQADGLPRELKARRGHVGAVDHMCFYDDEGTELLTTSALRGRGHVGKTSFIQQQQSCEFSAKLLRKKAPHWGLPYKRLPPVIAFACAPSRHFDWPNVVSIHRNCHAAFLWSYHDRALAPLLLRVSRYAAAAATAVAVSACGHYVVVGYEDGSLHRFNLQSGAYRGAYTLQQQQQQNSSMVKGIAAHVCGLAILNSAVVLSACAHPQDAALYTWDLLSRKLQQRFELPSDRLPAHTRYSHNSSSSCSKSSGVHSFCCAGTLAAVTMQSGVVFLVDVISRTTLRRIWQQGAPAAAVAFSPDKRWLAVAAAAGAPAGPSLFVYDVLSATVVDWMGFGTPVKALTFDPSGAFLLTSHDQAGGGGLCVWANKYAFDPALAAPLLNSNCGAPIFVEEPPPEMQQQEEEAPSDTEEKRQHQRLEVIQQAVPQQNGLPKKGEDGVTANDVKKQQQQQMMCIGPQYKTERRQLFEGLFTLSSVAPAKLQAIVCLEELRAKCKPKVRVAEGVPDAPFFLPTRASLEGTRFALPNGEEQQEKAARKRQKAEEDAADSAAAFFSGAMPERASLQQQGKKVESSEAAAEANETKKKKKKKVVDYRSPLQKLLAAAAAVEATPTQTAAAADSSSSSTQDKQTSTCVSTLSSTSRRSSKIFESILLYLRGLSPSAAAGALQDVGFYSGGTKEELLMLLRFFNYHVARRHQADLVQALLHVFLEAHGDTLAAAAPLSEEARLCRRLHARMSRDWRNLESCFERLQCYLKFLTHLETV